MDFDQLEARYNALRQIDYREEFKPIIANLEYLLSKVKNIASNQAENNIDSVELANKVLELKLMVDQNGGKRTKKYKCNKYKNKRLRKTNKKYKSRSRR